MSFQPWLWLGLKIKRLVQRTLKRQGHQSSLAEWEEVAGGTRENQRRTPSILHEGSKYAYYTTGLVLKLIHTGTLQLTSGRLA